MLNSPNEAGQLGVSDQKDMKALNLEAFLETSRCLFACCKSSEEVSQLARILCIEVSNCAQDAEKSLTGEEGAVYCLG